MIMMFLFANGDLRTPKTRPISPFTRRRVIESIREDALDPLELRRPGQRAGQPPLSKHPCAYCRR